MEDIYKIQAQYYANLPLLDRKYVASVHVENGADKAFWDPMLQCVEKGEYFFISHSKAKNGNETSGCEQCLRYRPYLSRRFFIAIDSDLRYVKEEPDFDAEHFIAQTYTYSWENHFCEAHALQNRFEQAFSEKGQAVTFDFVWFLEHLSSILYTPLLYVIYDTSAKVTEVFNCMPSQFSYENLANNGSGLLTEIQKKLADMNLTYSEKKASATADMLRKLGITETNAYLHVRGHNLFNMIRCMGTMLCHKARIAFTRDVLMHCPSPDYSYWEIKRVEDDLRTIAIADAYEKAYIYNHQ